jgi:oxygen-independent coproporphyrinogen-3 oxidase
MAGIYIHVPFCKQACHYCNFHFSTQTSNIDDYVNALLKEIEIQKDFFNGSIDSIYIGGGTPSLLSNSNLSMIFEALEKNFNISTVSEITMECNPDNLNDEYLLNIKKTPINRLSIGVQSFFDNQLQLMNRAHSANESINSVKRAQDIGFENISIDLMYGLPELSIDDWNKNLKTVGDLNIQHLSCYALTVEEKTALSHFLKNKNMKVGDESTVVTQLEILMKWATQNNFIQYEISNFGKEGFFSKHNSSYWFNQSYLGLGPSAHSFINDKRKWNISNNQLYIKNLLSDNKLLFEEETLSKDEQYNEYIMTRLRTIWGVDIFEIENKFGKEYINYFLKEIDTYINQNLVSLIDKKYILTNEGKFIGDSIASDLFFVK